MILKVGANTDIISLHTSIAGYLKTGAVYLDCIGEKANYKAVKAVMHVQNEFTNRPVEISLKPVILDTPDGERYGVRRELKVKHN